MQNGGNGLLLDLLRSKWGPVDREGCGVPQNGGNRLVLEHYGRNGVPVHREGCGVPQNETPRDIFHPSTPSSLHELLFIHRRPPPASTCDCSSTGSCSSTLHHALLQRLLFN